MAEVESPDMLGNEKRQMTFSDAANASEMRLESAPIAVHVLCMHWPANIFAGIMIDPVVEVSVSRQMTISFPAIGIDDASTNDGIEDMFVERTILRILGEPNANLRQFVSGPLDNAENGLFRCSAASFRSLPTNVDCLVLPRAADIGLVRLTDSREQHRNIDAHRRTDRLNGFGRRSVSQLRDVLDGQRRSVPHESFDDAEPLTA